MARDGRVVATPEEAKAQLAEIREQGALLTDNLSRADVCHLCFLGLSARDMENLRLAADAEPGVKNYAVLVRRLIARAAADAMEGRQGKLM